MHDTSLSSDKHLALELCCIHLSENLWLLQSCTQSQCSLGGCVHLSLNTAAIYMHPLMHVAIFWSMQQKHIQALTIVLQATCNPEVVL